MSAPFMPEPRLAVVAQHASWLTTVALLIPLAGCGGPSEPTLGTTVKVGPRPLMVGDTTLVTVQVRDPGGNPLLGQNVRLSLVGGTATGSFGPVTDRGGGTYTSVFTGTGFGTPARLGVQLGDGPVATPGESLSVVGFTQVSVGSLHACGTVNTGDAYCWGSGFVGQLGVGPAPGITDGLLKPTKVSGGIAWRHVGAGADMSCGLATSGTVHCWGASPNNYATGRASPGNPTVPGLIDGSYTFSSLTVGWGMGACGLTTANVPVCWGANAFGRVGNGAVSPGEPPSVVNGVPSFASIQTDYFVSCGITAAGTTYCWGSNLTGLLGVADSTLSVTCELETKCSPVPLAVPGADGMVPSSLTVGQSTACALKPDGAAYCWGFFDTGNNGQAAPAVPVATSLRFRQIVASHVICGIATDGETYCWGDNTFGTTGTGTVGGRVTTPTPVATDVKFVALDAGIGSTCGVTADGHVYCWGGNMGGQLGDGTKVDREVPTLVQSMH